MIEIKSAKKYYNRHKRNQVTAIDDTSLTLGDSGLVAILGNSGCGKTTLLNMIGGLDKPDSGKIFVNGVKMNGLFSGRTDNIRNRNIGYIFQNYHLIDSMTVFDNVAMVLKMRGVKNKTQLKQSVGYVLDKLGLYRYRNRPAGSLSGGERQRVGIARAIVKNPGIIIADEPTGNLDSGNSLEVMSIIRAISREKLVILVTHERNLAEFYADRIIEIVDGRVVDDRINEHDDKLDYRVDNRLYLQDFEKQSILQSEGINLSFYSDGSSDLDVKLVLRNGNLYIQCDGTKVEPVDADSAVELIDDHYHSLSLEEASANKLDYSRLSTGKANPRYHSVYNIFNIFVAGLRKVMSYKLIKKVLLLGFVASAMFIMYAISSVLGVNTVTDDKFITVHRDYLYLANARNTVEDYVATENLAGVKYIIPGNSRLCLTTSYSDLYYQSSDAEDSFCGSVAAASLLSESDIVSGRLPQTENELVMDKFMFSDILESGVGSMLGFSAEEDYLGREFTVEGHSFVLVGICDQNQPCLFVQDDVIFDIVMWADGSLTEDENNNAQVALAESAKGTLKLKKGKWPENAYEAVVPYEYRSELKIGKNIPGKIDGKTVRIVGYYTSTSSEDTAYYVTEDTIKYKYIYGTSGITIMAEDQQSVLDYFKEQNRDIRQTYETAKKEYEADLSDTVRQTTIIAAIVMIISLVEIYLMLRSSFLSRVKEVGILRAIGLKKSDVYKMFLGEILAITTLTAPLAFVIMGYILHTLVKVEYFADMYVFNSTVVIASVVIVYAFNIVAGLLPVISTLRQTPAAILARTDVD